MTDANPQVVAFVESELKRNPDASAKDLREKARQIDPTVGELTGRQFHAQYALQARRKLSAGRRSPSRSRAAMVEGPPGDAAVHDLLIEGFESKKAALDNAIRDAFERALAADSVTGVNRLFSALDQHRKAFSKIGRK